MPRGDAVAQLLAGCAPVPPGTSVAFLGPDAAPTLANLSRAAFPTERIPAARFRHFMGPGNSFVLGLSRNGQLASYALIKLNRGQSRAYLEETVTAPDHQGVGFGSWIFRECLRIVAALGYARFASHVAVTNIPSLRLHHAVGMREVGREPGFYADGGEAIRFLKLLVDPNEEPPRKA